MVFRITPSLGPDLEQFAAQFYWDLNSDTPTYALGSKVIGSDGHDYVLVEAGAAFATAGTDVTINETTWVATAGAGGFETPIAGIASGDRFHARRTTL